MIPLPSHLLGDLAATLKTEELRAAAPLGLVRAVRRVADEQGVSVARFVREAVADRVVQASGLAQPEAPQALAKE